MEIINKYVTFDGVEHTTEKRAISHLERLYSDLISELASQIRTAQWHEVVEKIDDRLSDYVQLSRIKEDMRVPSMKEED